MRLHAGRTLYETVCATRQKVHEVEDDVADCKTETMTKCQEVVQGYQTKQECEDWPVQRCNLVKETRKKYTPETKCTKEPREVCAPEGCGFRNVRYHLFKARFLSDILGRKSLIFDTISQLGSAVPIKSKSQLFSHSNDGL